MTWPDGDLDPWPDCPVCHGSGVEVSHADNGPDELIPCSCLWPGEVPDPVPEPPVEDHA